MESLNKKDENKQTNIHVHQNGNISINEKKRNFVSVLCLYLFDKKIVYLIRYYLQFDKAFFSMEIVD